MGIVLMAAGSDAAVSSLSCVQCGKPAHLQCPKCVELKLPREGAAFCTQDCFKSSWSTHKSVHLKEKLSALGLGAPGEQNSASPNDGWLYCLKKGRARTPKLPHFDWTGSLRPYPISRRRAVPADIDQPDWAIGGIPKIEPNSDLQHVVEIAREVLDAAARVVRPGVTTDEIDDVVHEATIAAGGYPSPLNYHFFPKSCCTSVNEVICHGIPDARKLEDGDIVNVDVTVYYKGVHGDLNETFFVGNVDDASRQLVQCTYECLEKAIAIVKPGVRFREIGEVINRHASMAGFSVARSYCGHGIGELFHCAPNIPHYARNKAVGVMKAGQTYTIEPMINAGVWRDRMWPDGWTDVTADGKHSAQFEHTLLVKTGACLSSIWAFHSAYFHSSLLPYANECFDKHVEAWRPYMQHLLLDVDSVQLASMNNPPEIFINFCFCVSIGDGNGCRSSHSALAFIPQCVSLAKFITSGSKFWWELKTGPDDTISDIAKRYASVPFLHCCICNLLILEILVSHFICDKVLN
ncbi:hypothetical protein RHMOL_Rhmol07G0034000 [Rhododendron molle]|uniref:Uncharacterized protein n=1 Tax=Rhododendron molle TaxID=49168 RepID=A0ACC0MYK0_RHOML|nr:hypothetical protein RHMOL_Rhmol07G0034000 [Rhododendron molle]